MKKFEGILICTDLDGTLLKNDKSVSRENSEAIEYFKAEGGYFTFVTGRMPYFARMVKDIIKPNAPIGCVNGGGVYDYESERYLSLKILPNDVSELIFDVVDAVEGVGVIVNTKDKLFFPYDNDASKRHRAATGMPYADLDLRNHDKEIAKIVFGDLREEAIQKVAKTLAEHKRAAEFDFIRSEKSLYEILPKNTTKGNILPELSSFLGIDMKRTVAIGDYDNDVDMIRRAGVGIAVANACQNAKDVADYITVSNEEHAIARVISDIEKGVIKFPD